jgi:glycyl-tRNA synthetase
MHVLSMQEALLALTRYWTERGCGLAQPMNTEVGAGTMNPATFLRVLGPEPWRVAYVEPSVRPDDARYGENPNRLQTHTQFQVILKPEPGNSQELYLGSLAALGIDVDAHDVRFVEDNWASPALGAWGLGWEVWLDGLEITQFTYFQQAGGIALTPVSVEITYGMERILMALQRVSHFKDIRYTPGGVSYGEIFGQAEYEMSRYYLDEADVAANRSLLDLYENEASRMLAARLPIPAYSYVLKCSHTFNVLDARGAVSPTDRARVFARIRRLASGVARLWVERREELGYPFGISQEPPVPVAATLRPAPGEPATLVLEIGVEELPAAEVTAGASALQKLLAERLAASRLDHGPVTAFGTPRRLVAVVPDVAPRQDDRDVQARGPRVQAAYAADGTPTKAAIGFARAQEVPVTELGRVEVGGVEYAAVSRRETGRPAAEILTELLPGVVSALPADSNMRWDAPGLAYVRPIRWLLALLADTVLPFTVSSLASGRVTRIRHGAQNTEFDVAHADGYLEFLAGHGVIGHPSDRRQAVLDQAAELAAGAGGERSATSNCRTRCWRRSCASISAICRCAGRTARCRRTSSPSPTGPARRTWSGPATRRCCAPGSRTPASSGGPTWPRRWRSSTPRSASSRSRNGWARCWTGPGGSAPSRCSWPTWWVWPDRIGRSWRAAPRWSSSTWPPSWLPSCRAWPG